METSNLIVFSLQAILKVFLALFLKQVFRRLCPICGRRNGEPGKKEMEKNI